MEINDFKEALENDDLEHVIKVLKQKSNKQQILHSLADQGQDYINSGKTNKALSFLNKVLTVSQELGSVGSISHSLSNIGFAHCTRGELDLAFEKLQESLTLSENLNEKWIYTIALTTSGHAYYLRGELDQALACLQKSKRIAESTRNHITLAYVFYNMAKIHKDKNELNRALDYYSRCLSLFRDIGNDYGIAITLFRLAEINIESKSLDQAERYLEELDKLKVSNKQVVLRKRLIKALILKNSPRASQKVEAQTILQEIIDGELIDHELTLLALLNLCEILSDEYKFFREQEVLTEISSLLDQLYRTGKDYQSYPLLVEVLVLKSRTSLINGDLEEADALLDQALIFSEEKGLSQLKLRIRNKRSVFQKELNNWKELTRNNVSVSERFEQAELKDYIKEAIEVVGRSI